MDTLMRSSPTILYPTLLKIDLINRPIMLMLFGYSKASNQIMVLSLPTIQTKKAFHITSLLNGKMVLKHSNHLAPLSRMIQSLLPTTHMRTTSSTLPDGNFSNAFQLIRIDSTRWLFKQMFPPHHKKDQSITLVSSSLAMSNKAFELDAKNGNTLWKDAMTKEIENIQSYQTFKDMGKVTHLSGYKMIIVHFVFVVKHCLSADENIEPSHN
jgi:hypothetical protein